MIKAYLIAAMTAASIDIDIQNFTAYRGISTITMAVTNNGTKTATRIFIDCVFLDKDMRAIDIGRDIVSNLPPGQTKFSQAAIPTTQGVEHAECYVDQIN